MYMYFLNYLIIVIVSGFINGGVVFFFFSFQIICSLLSVDGQHDQEVLSINGACAALMLSDIPWNGPIGN